MFVTESWYRNFVAVFQFQSIRLSSPNVAPDIPIQPHYAWHVCPSYIIYNAIPKLSLAHPIITFYISNNPLFSHNQKRSEISFEETEKHWRERFNVEKAVPKRSIVLLNSMDTSPMSFESWISSFAISIIYHTYCINFKRELAQRRAGKASIRFTNNAKYISIACIICGLTSGILPVSICKWLLFICPVSILHNNYITSSINGILQLSRLYYCFSTHRFIQPKDIQTVIFMFV